MLSACAIHQLKALNEILVSKYLHCLFYKFPQWDFPNFLPFLAITFEAETLESLSNHLKQGSQPFHNLIPLGHPVLSRRSTSFRRTNLIEYSFIQKNNIH